jgi:LSD1 subclass zinc finger protein
MNLQPTTCPACNATIHVPPGAARVSCAYCGRELAVSQSGSETKVALLDQLKETLHDLGQQQQAAIQESSSLTRTELERLQLNQQLTTLQMQHSGLRAEIRALERETSPSNTVRRQLRELRREERAYQSQISALEAKLNPDSGGAKTAVSTPSTTRQTGPSPLRGLGSSLFPLFKGCLGGCLTYFIVAIGLGMIAVPLDRWLFNVAPDDETGGPFFVIAAVVGLIAAAITFFYLLFPQAAIWQRLTPKKQKKAE